MKTAPVIAAQVDFASDPAAPRAPAFDDLYHPRAGAFAQAHRVFLAGNGLPERWRGRERFTVLETGFGLGNNFLATWAAWRDDSARCQRLTFISIEKHPLTAADMARAHVASPVPDIARELLAAWPALTCNLHGLDFDGGRVRLLLSFGDITQWARQIVARVDAFCLDGFAPARNPAMWDRSVFAMLTRLAAPGATAATWSAARAVREGLQGAGFEVHAAAGGGGKREITVARFAPRFMPKAPPGRALLAQAPSHAIVVGAGIAGAATAAALARQGVECLVLEHRAEPAAEASGNVAGLFHGTVMGHDGPHARLHRACALWAPRAMREAIAAGVPGHAQGLLRVVSRLSLAEMHALIERQGLPTEFVQALAAVEAARRSDVPLAAPAWFYPGGGWIAPAALVRHWLATPGVICRTGTAVQRMEHRAAGWALFDTHDRLIAQAPLVVLANAHDAARLAGAAPPWPLRSLRGQVTQIAHGDVTGPRPRLPISGAGYALTLPDGSLLCGATSSDEDDDPDLREADHHFNLARAARLLGGAPVAAGAPLQGRVGWRVSSDDRLPLIGPLHDATARQPTRRDSARLLPRREGLWIHSALGSRGLTTAPLLAEVLAAWASGAPLPLEADLVDAIDVARLSMRNPQR